MYANVPVTKSTVVPGIRKDSREAGITEPRSRMEKTTTWRKSHTFLLINLAPIRRSPTATEHDKRGLIKYDATSSHEAMRSLDDAFQA